MAETSGLVQRVTVLGSSSIACTWIGPTPNNTELLFISRSDTDAANVGAFKNSMADTLVTAYLNRQEVVAVHDDSSAEITALRLEPS